MNCGSSVSIVAHCYQSQSATRQHAVWLAMCQHFCFHMRGCIASEFQWSGKASFRMHLFVPWNPNQGWSNPYARHESGAYVWSTSEYSMAQMCSPPPPNKEWTVSALPLRHILVTDTNDRHKWQTYPLAAVSLKAFADSQRQFSSYDRFLSSFRLHYFYITLMIASEMHFNACQYIAQPNTTCI